MKTLYYDCFAGISGDMHLAALIDLGVDAAMVARELASLPIGQFELRTSPSTRNGIAGTRVDVVIPAHGDHAHHHHRTHADIRALIGASTLAAPVKDLSIRIFSCLADAEAAIHGTTPDKVHFHEVGAVDSIVDIVGAAICLDALKPDCILCSPVELGGGTVTCAHGILPVPAPATAALLKGKPVTMGRTSFESTTPTGAAILAAVVNEFVDRAAMTIDRIGYGIGHREAVIPNMLRVLFGQSTSAAGDDTIVVVEATIDDMNPELYDHVMELLFAAGALDVFITPVIMKKSRPGTTLSVLAPRQAAQTLSSIVLAETTTLGVRTHEAKRTVLQREMTTVHTPYGAVRVKSCFLNGRMLRCKPEFDDCRKLALEHKVPIQDIYRAVVRADQSPASTP